MSKMIITLNSRRQVFSLIEAVQELRYKINQLFLYSYKAKGGAVGRVNYCNTCGGRKDKVNPMIDWKDWSKIQKLRIKNLDNILKQLDRINLDERKRKGIKVL